MTINHLLDLAVLVFKERDLREPAEADRFFAEYGIGNTVEFPASPYERFVYYKELLTRLRASDKQKFASVHKGVPLYFLSWLAFDLHQFEAALHFLDACIEEDKNKAPTEWFQNPAAQFLVLNASVQGAQRTAQMLASRIDQELSRFQGHYGVALARSDFLARFAKPMLMNAAGAVVAGFYAFVLEFDDRAMEITLRSAPHLGSYQPLFLHLFKGGLLLETLLKLSFSHLSAKTLGDILHHQDFKDKVGFNPPSIKIRDPEVPISTLCTDARSATPEAAFLATGRLRNMMGHNLIRDPLPSLPDDYITLARQEINAFLYAVAKLYP